jgi:hypothetical protein
LKETRCGGGSTSKLHTHLTTLHNINLRKRDVQVSNLENDEHELTTTKDAKSKYLLTDYFKSDKRKKLLEVLACMTAYDGLLFHLFSASIDVRRGLITRGCSDLPKSPITINKMVMDYRSHI